MKPRQGGSTSIEFALVLLVFLTFLLGIMDFARMLYTWNAANEATRAGARFAVVCHDSATAENTEAVRDRMRGLLPNIDTIAVQWVPNGCDHTTCQGVRVGITGLEFDWLSPITAYASSLAMPSFVTYLPREVMRQDPLSNSHWCVNPISP